MSTLRFSRSLIETFFKVYKLDPQYRGQRIGQAFYNYFTLHKHTGDKHELDRLYEMDGEPARKWIEQHTDYQQ